MKKMIFGILLFVSSSAALLTIFVISFNYPAVYNDLSGVLGFIKANGYLIPVIILIIVAIYGISLCAIEAFKDEE